MAVRKSNMEMVRIVAMSMILILHIIGHMVGSDSPKDARISHFASSLVMCGVNLFFMLSGYFQIRLTKKSLFKLIFLIFFFTAINYILAITAGITPSVGDWLNMIFFPVSKSAYWFIQVYFFLIITSPLLNAGLNHLTHAQLRRFIIIFTVFTIYSCGMGHNLSNNNGYSYLQGFYMYCVANWIKRDANILEIFKPSILLVSFTILVLLGAFGYAFTGVSSFSSYNSAITIFASVALFLYFTRLKFQNKFVNSVATAALGCYLLQDGYLGNEVLYKWGHSVFENSTTSVFILYCIIMFISFWLASWIFTKICTFFERLIYDNLIVKIKNPLRRLY